MGRARGGNVVARQLGAFVLWFRPVTRRALVSGGVELRATLTPDETHHVAPGVLSAAADVDAQRRSSTPRMNVAAYLRVSTTQQDWTTQRATIKRAAKARGDEISGVNWFEEKVSGVATLRELAKIREGARRGEIRKLYVYAFDRLGRGGIAETLNIVRELRAHGCEVVSMIDGFDVAGPGGELALAVMAWAAEQERKRLRERMRDARARVEAEGGRWGRPRTIDPTTLELARTLRDQGRPISRIAAKLKVPKSTLQRALAQKGHYKRVAKTATK